MNLLGPPHNHAEQANGLGNGGGLPHPGGNGLFSSDNALSNLASIIHSILSGGQTGFGLGALSGMHAPGPPALPEGTYTGAYAAQGLRTSDPSAAAQLWESRHPYAMSHGHVPNWVTQALLHAIHSAGSAPAAPAPVPSYQAQ